MDVLANGESNVDITPEGYALDIDLELDESIENRMRVLPEEDYDLAVRVSVTVTASPYKVKDSNDVATCLYSIMSGPFSNTVLYHYMLYEADSFFKDIRPDTINSYDFSGAVDESNDGLIDDISSSGSLGQTLIIVAAIVVGICIAIVGYIKFHRRSDTANRNDSAVNEEMIDEENDGENSQQSQDDNNSELFQVVTVDTVSSMDVSPNASFEPFLFEEAHTSFKTVMPSNDAAANSTNKNSAGAIEVRWERS